MPSPRRLAVLLGLFASATPAPQAGAATGPPTDTRNSSSKNPLTGDFARFVEQTLDAFKVPGISIAVVDHDNVYAEGYGFSNLPDTPATPDTLWYAGSTTKAFTAACMSSLIQSGRHQVLARNWSTPVSSILNGTFVLDDAWATKHITLDDAVSHRSGFPRYDQALLGEQDGALVGPEAIVRNMRNLPLGAEPRTKFLYNNWMFITLSLAIERITGKFLGDTMRELIWGPLGMDSTYFTVKEYAGVQQHMASGYLWDENSNNYSQTLPMPMTDLSGSAGIVSNVLDYAKWIKLLLNKSQPFSESVHDDIRQPRMISGEAGILPFSDDNLYSLGWFRGSYRGHVVYSHDGSMIGFRARVYWLPDDNFGLVMFANEESRAEQLETVVSWKLLVDRLGGPASDQKNLTTEHLEAVKTEQKYLADAVDNVYPNLTQSRTPSSFSTSDLQGTYVSTAWPKVTLREEPHPGKPGEKLLVAERADATWREAWYLDHVSGDDWLVRAGRLEDRSNVNEVFRATFIKGSDGKVSAMGVRWAESELPDNDQVFVFEKEGSPAETGNARVW